MERCSRYLCPAQIQTPCKPLSMEGLACTYNYSKHSSSGVVSKNSICFCMRAGVAYTTATSWLARGRQLSRVSRVSGGCPRGLARANKKSHGRAVRKTNRPTAIQRQIRKIADLYKNKRTNSHTTAGPIRKKPKENSQQFLLE